MQRQSQQCRYIKTSAPNTVISNQRETKPWSPIIYSSPSLRLTHMENGYALSISVYGMENLIKTLPLPIKIG